MNKHKFLKPFLIYGLVTGLSRLLPIILLPLYLSVLSKEDYGRIEVLVALFNLLVIIGSVQLDASLQRFMFKVKNKFIYIHTIFIFVLILSTACMLIVSTQSEKISMLLFGVSNFGPSITLTAMCAISFNLSSILMINYRYNNEENLYAIVNVLQVVVTTALTYWLVVIKDGGVLGFIVGMNSGWMFVLIVCYIHFLSRYGLLRVDISGLRDSILFAFPQLPARFLSYFLQHGNRFVVLYVLGSGSVALLGLASKFAAPIQLLYIAFSMTWGPYLYKNEDNPKLDLIIKKALIFVCVVLCIIILIIQLFGPYVIYRYFDETYADVSQLIALAIIPAGIIIVKEIVESGIRLASKTKYITYAYTASALTSLILMLNSNDIVEIMTSSVVGMIVLLLLIIFYSELTHNIKYSRPPLTIFLIFIISVSVFSISVYK